MSSFPVVGEDSEKIIVGIVSVSSPFPFGISDLTLVGSVENPELIGQVEGLLTEFIDIIDGGSPFSF